MRCHADLRIHITRRCHRAHAGDLCKPLFRGLNRAPAILTKAHHIGINERRAFPIRHVDLGVSRGMLHRRTNAVTPRAFWRVLGESGANVAKLLCHLSLVLVVMSRLPYQARRDRSGLVQSLRTRL